MGCFNNFVYSSTLLYCRWKVQTKDFVLYREFHLFCVKYHKIQSMHAKKMSKFTEMICNNFFFANCRIVYRGVKRLLTVKDFLPLAVKLKSSCTYELFSKHWKFHL